MSPEKEALKLIEKRLSDPDLTEHERAGYELCLAIWEPYMLWLNRQKGRKAGSIADSMTLAIVSVAIDTLFTVGLLKDKERRKFNPGIFLRSFKTEFNNTLNNILQMED